MNGSNRREAPAPSELRDALAAWRNVLGTARVLTCGERLEAAQRATFATEQRVSAILEPCTREETAHCLRIAGRYGIPIHPVSGGRNWGYGSKVPPQDGAVLLSLARMDRILDFSEELAYVTIEPGVTFGRLAAFLAERGSSLLPPATGSTPEASIVGNVLERGIGKGMYEDMGAHGCGYEVVLASGETVKCGMTGYPGARTAELRADGPGPSLLGLFQQSRLGVVTRMTIWLEPAPALQQNIVFAIRDGQLLAGVIEKLRTLLLRRDSGMQAELINDYRLLAMNRTYPFDNRPDLSALTSSEAADLLGPASPGRWFGCARIWGDDGQELEWRRNRLNRGLQAMGIETVAAPPANGLSVVTTSDGIRSAYWRKKSGVPDGPDPDRDGCGVIWLAPVLPMLGDVAAEALEQVERTVLRADFEPSVSLRMIGGRAIQAIIGVVYDRGVAGADESAVRCHAMLRELLDRKGFYPYRTGLLDCSMMPERTGDTESVLQSIRRVLDPGGILC